MDESDWQPFNNLSLHEVHVGQQLRVQISYVDGQGNLETLVSPASTPVQNVNDKPTGAPRLTGEAREEGALVVDTSLIADEDGVGTYSVIWQRSSTKTDWQAYPNAVGEVLQLTQSHVGYSYRAVVSYTDRRGTKEMLLTAHPKPYPMLMIRSKVVCWRAKPQRGAH